jgi:hypothetical protein
MSLPFLEADENLHLNLSVIVILLQCLGKSSRGTLKLNNDRLHAYHFLIKNPVKLNQVMPLLGKNGLLLSHQDSFSVASISANVDPLFDREALKSLLTILISQQIVDVEYRKKEGFFYKLTNLGETKAELLNGEFFSEMRIACEQLKGTLSISQSVINKALNQIMIRDAF